MIRASALGRLPSDPPSLRTNVMEAEGGAEGEGGGSFLHLRRVSIQATWDEVCACEIKEAVWRHRRP